MSSKLVDFLQQNKGIGQPLRVALSDDKKEATVWLYDVISSFWGISAKDFNKELMDLDVDTIHVRINSPGGDVYEARAIQTALAQSGKHVVIHIDGLAASAASFIALAGDERYIADGAWYMIHNAWTMVAGDKNALVNEATYLDRIDTSLRKDYVKATGNSEEQVQEWMDNETWFDANEALENGFVTEIVDNVKAPANMWNLAQYTNVPQALGTVPPQVQKTSVVTMDKIQTKENTNMAEDNRLTEMEQKLADAEKRAKASEEKMAEYEARVEEMARNAFKKELVNSIGSEDADVVMALYGHVDASVIQKVVDKIEGYQAKLNELGAEKGTDDVPPIDDEQPIAFADIQKYATEHGISFMEANRIMHESKE